MIVLACPVWCNCFVTVNVRSESLLLLDYFILLINLLAVVLCTFIHCLIIPNLMRNVFLEICRRQSPS